MRSVILGAILALVSACLFAGEIPSDASGHYIAPDRVCRLVLSDYMGTHIDVDLVCVTDSGWPTSSRTLAEAPRPRCIGSPFVTTIFALDGANAGAGFVSFEAFAADELVVRVAASQNELVNGGGVAQVWVRERALPSPTPFSCGQSAPPPITRRQRDLVCRVNPSAPSCGR